MKVLLPKSIEELLGLGLLIVGEGAIIENNVVLCHPTKTGVQDLVVIGQSCWIRSGAVIYSGVTIGSFCQTGHHIVVRENTRIGHHSVIGTGVKIEMDTVIGNYVLVETLAHVTARMVIEDYVFVGPSVVTTNDMRMLWQRKGAGQFLEGPVLKWGCRIGGGATILPGVVVGREAIVAAGSVVARDVPSRKVVAGNPARVVADVGRDEPVRRRDDLDSDH